MPADALQLIAESLPSPIAVYGPDFRIRYLNPPARRAVRLRDGITDPIGVHLDDLNYPAELLKMVRDLLNRAVQTGESHTAELESPRPEGSRVFQVTVTPSVVDGQVESIASIATDITQLRDAHRQLAEQTVRYKATIRAAGVYEWHHDYRTQRVEITDESLLLLGLTRDTMPPTDEGWFSRFHPDDTPAILAAVSKAFRGETPGFEYEFRATGFDGVERWFLTRALVTRDADGTPKCADGVTIEITERKRAEQALAESQELFRRFMEFCPAAAWMKSPDGRYELVNTRLELHAGLAASKILNRSTDEVFPPDVASVFIEHDRKVLETGESITATEFLRTPEGRHIPCLVVRFPIDSPSGRRLGGFSLDISELHRLQEEQRTIERQLLHAQKLESLGVLAGGIAHDFNNLLTSVLGYASLARMEPDVTADVQGHLGQIESAAQRAAELCKQMLAYAGRGSVSIQHVELNSLVHEMAQLLSTAISKRATLKFNLSSRLPLVRADPTQLRQVVMNLITNASDAIAEHSGVITLSTGLIDADTQYLTEIGMPTLPPCQYAYIEVSDTGIGMTEEVKARVFEPFFSTKFTGRGLGLAAVQGIIRAHNGAIKIYSQLGRGTTFKVLLPVSDDPAELPPHKTLAPKIGHGRDRWVLVVDDEEDVRVLARKVLTRVGFQVMTANDGLEAVTTFRADPNRYEAVILDLTMPRMNGIEAFRLLRLTRPDIKVILTSGYAAEEATTGFQGKGLAAFVRKPFLVDELMAAVAQAVGD